MNLINQPNLFSVILNNRNQFSSNSIESNSNRLSVFYWQESNTTTRRCIKTGIIAFQENNKYVDGFRSSGIFSNLRISLATYALVGWYPATIYQRAYKNENKVRESRKRGTGQRRDVHSNEREWVSEWDSVRFVVMLVTVTTDVYDTMTNYLNVHKRTNP